MKGAREQMFTESATLRAPRVRWALRSAPRFVPFDLDPPPQALTGPRQGGRAAQELFLVSFDQVGLAPELLRAVAQQGYTEPTPVQRESIPHVLAGREDVVRRRRQGR